MSNELVEAYDYLTSLPRAEADEVARTAYACMSEGERQESRALVRAAGARVTIKPRGGHQVALIEFSGRSRKVYIASSPSDCNGFKSAARDARRVLHEMGALV